MGVDILFYSGCQGFLQAHLHHWDPQQTSKTKWEVLCSSFHLSGCSVSNHLKANSSKTFCVLPAMWGQNEDDQRYVEQDPPLSLVRGALQAIVWGRGLRQVEGQVGQTVWLKDSPPARSWKASILQRSSSTHEHYWCFEAGQVRLFQVHFNWLASWGKGEFHHCRTPVEVHCWLWRITWWNEAVSVSDHHHARIQRPPQNAPLLCLTSSNHQAPLRELWFREQHFFSRLIPLFLPRYPHHFLSIRLRRCCPAWPQRNWRGCGRFDPHW